LESRVTQLEDVIKNTFEGTTNLLDQLSNEINNVQILEERIDRKLSKTELKETILSLAKNIIDVNEDGEIDIKDLRILGSKLKKIVDTDGNGEVSKSEWSSFKKKMKQLLIDAGITIVLTMVIMYFANMNNFFTLLLTWEPEFGTAFIGMALFIAGLLGFKEKYGNDIKNLITKIDSKDLTIEKLKEDMKKKDDTIANNNSIKQKELLDAEIIHLKDERDLMKSVYANTEAIIKAAGTSALSPTK